MMAEKSAFRVKGCLELSLHSFSLCMVLAAGLCFTGLAFEVMVDDGRVWRKYCLCTYFRRQDGSECRGGA
jgi:hypothetical protein